MTTSKIQYGVQDGTSGAVSLLTDDDDREDAIKYAAYLTNRTGRMFVAVERTITWSDWKPTNTGVVPPFITEKSNAEDA